MNVNLYLDFASKFACTAADFTKTFTTTGITILQHQS